MKRIKETQVVIIGGGIVGTAIAHALSRYKLDVSLLEKEPAFGFGITKACMGGLHGGISLYLSKIVKWWAGAGDLRSYLTASHHLKDSLNAPGRKMYLELSPYLNAKVVNCGRLVVAETEDEIEKMKIMKALIGEQGGSEITLLDRDGLKEMEPMIAPRFIGGIFDPEESAILATEWAMAFADCARQNGVNTLLNTVFTSIEEKNGSFIIHTNNEPIRSEYVINTAGVYSDDIAAMMGPIDFSFNIWKCQILVLENKNYIGRVLSAIPKPQNPRGLFYTPDGNILAIHTMDLTKNKNDQSTTSEGLNKLSGFLNYYIPEAELNVIRSFAGFLHFNTRNPDDYILEFTRPNFLNVIACPPAAGPAPALAIEVVKRLAEHGLELAEKTDFNPYRTKEPRFIDIPIEEKNRKIQANPACGHLICRCEMVAEEEIRQAVRAGATTLDEIKFRTRAGMGRCQGGFCTSRAIQIMAEERGVAPQKITLKGGQSYILARETKDSSAG